jgi:hypothetical protein
MLLQDTNQSFYNFFVMMLQDYKQILYKFCFVMLLQDYKQVLDNFCFVMLLQD